MANELEEHIRAVIAEQLGVEPLKVTRDASFIDDLGADSLDTVELTLAVEEELGFAIPEDEAPRDEARPGEAEEEGAALRRRRLLPHRARLHFGVGEFWYNKHKQLRFQNKEELWPS